MPKVLDVFTTSLHRNGIVLFALRFSRGLSADFATCMDVDDSLRQEIEANGIGVIKLASNRNKKPFAYVRELKKLIRDGGYDIVHAHGNSATLFMEMLSAKLAGVRVRIAHSHNTTCKHKALDTLLRLPFYATYTHALACSEAAGRWLFGRRAFTVIKNGIDVERYAFNEHVREEMRAKLGLDGHTAIGHAGRFNSQKNQRFLIEAFTQAAKKREDIRLYLMGDGAEMRAASDKIAKLGLDTRVTLTGAVSDMERYLCAMDVMALPSLYEGFPAALLEWQASGVATLASDTVTPEVNITGGVAFLPLDLETWADALANAHMSNNARNAASEHSRQALRAAGYDVCEGVNPLANYYINALDH